MVAGSKARERAQHETGQGAGTAPNLYFDRTLHIEAAKILPGEYYVTGRDMVLVTVLGSCVAACIRDPASGIGGMNHFMLPDTDKEAADLVGASARYGTYAMELLINELVKMGARRGALEAKVFGGGNVLRNMTVANVGGRNAEFVRKFLDTERIPITARDLNGDYARKVYFFPDSGRVRLKLIKSMHNRTILDREQAYGQRLRGERIGGEVELF
jgi:chemotaxis protein CheD